jgi:Zn-dependent peptidase ImmA (M78 family)/transcriptional regulator with XRE-family HTH domain
MTATAQINPQILRWMRQRSGLGVAEVAAAAGVKLEQISGWEAGDGAPTFRQAQRLAQAMHAPFGYLFLATPPPEVLPIPDLRTVAGSERPNPSLDLRETVRVALQRQEWYADYLRDQGQLPLPFVGRFSVESDIKSVAADIRAVLGQDLQQMHSTQDAYLSHLVQCAESAGVLVMRSGIVGSNTHRSLDVGEFRGFAISHPLAPLVFINSADAPAARLFTLVHELAHIWLGDSGVSSGAPGSQRREEVFCNAVAGEFLAPRELFLSLWAVNDADLPNKVSRLVQCLHVSALVVLRRALDLQLIDSGIYQQHYLAELQAFRHRDGSGGSFYRNAGAKNSRRFARAVVAEALSGRLLLRDAGRLLGVPPAKLQHFAEHLGE